MIQYYLELGLCAEKSEARDYSFFLEHGNFLKVVDTLEKFEERVVDTSTQEGKQFVLFKRQLYQLYEVQNRSTAEHEQFSFVVERNNLKWLYNANLDFIDEMNYVN